MNLFDKFRYDGKRVLVVGGATGMGAAAAALAKDAGAEVVVMDFADIPLDGVGKIQLNLADRASIDAAVDECGGRVDALFSCAGVADGTPGIERINFVGHRHLIDRLRSKAMLPRGSAICLISSSAGLGWETNLEELSEVLDIPDFDAAAKWFEDHEKSDYLTTKQAVCAYVARSSFELLKEGIRINAVCPGPTDTPLAQANKDMWLGFAADYREEVGLEPFTPMEQANPVLFLCSDAAAAITGITLLSDAGWLSSSTTGSFPDGKWIADILLNRTTE
ncbi:MAG: SDR family oxidoreductase [Candidatus Binatia bacterium]|nr:SDR family oxidoreductase [Candidatus Binatia bacterium]